MLGLIWWMYGAYAWLTNAVAPNSTPRRLAAARRDGRRSSCWRSRSRTAFERRGAGVRHRLPGRGRRPLRPVPARRVGELAAGHPRASCRSIWEPRCSCWSAGSRAASAQYVLWPAALLLEWARRCWRAARGLRDPAAHFVERHGLVVLIAIGESVVAVGVGVAAPAMRSTRAGAGRAARPRAQRRAVVDVLRRRRLSAQRRRSSPRRPQRQPVLVLVGYFYWHLLILLGIVLAASTLHDGDWPPVRRTVDGAGGAAGRRRRAVPGRRRAVPSHAAIGTPGGGRSRRCSRWRRSRSAARGSAAAQLVALVAVLLACLLLEQRTARRGRRPRPAQIRPRRDQSAASSAAAADARSAGVGAQLGAVHGCRGGRGAPASWPAVGAWPRFDQTASGRPESSTTRTMTGRTVKLTVTSVTLPPAAFTVRTPYRFGSRCASEVPTPGSASATIVKIIAPVNPLRTVPPPLRVVGLR